MVTVAYSQFHCNSCNLLVWPWPQPFYFVLYWSKKKKKSVA